MKILLLCAAIVLAGCDLPPSPVVDQCMRRDLFRACLAAVPVGPQSVKYNDWAEVLSECESAAYYQSLRQKEHVKSECRTQ